MRVCLWVLAAAMLAGAGELPSATTVRGKLSVESGRPAALVTAENKRIALVGDDETTKVLHDVRLNGFEVEAHGHFEAAGRFAIDPIHTRGLVARQNGHIKLITYYCEVCNIRADIPGPCACCQRETTLELIDPGQK